MKKICLILLCCLGCTMRQPFIIQPYSSPKVIVRTTEREVGVDLGNLENLGIENEPETSELFYPDPLKGYIENRALPFIPKVWMILDGTRIILIGPEEGPPQFWEGEIREFRFDPGLYVLHIERWIILANKWKKVGREKVVKLSVAQSEQQLRAAGHYGWWITINPDSIDVH